MYGTNTQKLKLGLGLYHLNKTEKIMQRHGVDIKEEYIDKKKANELWKLLRNGIQQILTGHYSNLNFEELHRYGYYLVMHKYGLMLYCGLKDIITHHLRSEVQQKLLVNLNSNFLLMIKNSWAEYLIHITMIREILMYMDRVYFKQNSLDDIYTLGLNLFKSEVVCFGSIKNLLQTTLLEMVESERKGKLVDRSILRYTTRLLMVLGNNSLTLYQEIFEEPFLQQSVNFFKMESKQLLEECNASLYLKIFETRVSEEIERAEQCFDEVTLLKITSIINEEVIKANMKSVAEMKNSGLIYMIEHQLFDDIACMYKLYCRVPDGLKVMFEIISEYIREQGETLVKDVENNKNALLYIQNIMDLKDKIDLHLMKLFSNNLHYKQIIHADFEHILSLDPNFPEYLSLFIDDKLRKTEKVMTDSAKTVLLDKTMALFRFVRDKDLFEHYYKIHLAKRLLLSKIINEDNEKNLITKFKTECGLQYTHKIEGMFKDIWISKRITEEFQDYVKDSDEPELGLNLSVNILTVIYWPTVHVSLPCKLPAAALNAFCTFQIFYLTRHCRRMLKLLPHLGSAELEMHRAGGEGWLTGKTCPYKLEVSTYQMCILMLFNDRPRWNYQELQAETNMSHTDLIRALQVLTFGKPSRRVLLKQPISRQIDIDDFFEINSQMSSKTNRVTIPFHLLKYETDSERQDTIRRINKDRSHEIEAAIIRIMKARRVITHERLMYELITLLTPRFVPTREQIKTRIDVLIDREYIARNSKDRQIYEYIT